ncbi:MAG: diguanylate cyclase [Bryobacteraceae bacterium]|jgi:diguanylate cyclase (GGDEF)-like protein
MDLLAEPINPVPNLAECAREPIQIIGHIQPHGLLFALSEPDLIIRQVSINVSTLLEVSPETLLGCSIESVLGPQQFDTFRSQVLNEPFSAKLFRIPANGRAIEMHCIAHRHDGVLIVELDLARGTHSLEPLKLDSHIQIPLGRMERATDTLELFRLAAEEIRRLSGFDRVMVYRFDESWNGEVIAEAVGAALPILYLGSRFPESDIPAQARQLFLMNPSRSIADVAAKPVPIIPEIGPLTGKPLDMTRSCLRSAAPIHLRYLRNMAVQSSMTLSIVVNRQLWGLMACHSTGPHRLDQSTRSVCELMVQIFASQVALRTDNFALQARLTSRKALEQYMTSVEASESLARNGHFQGTELLDLLGADGLVSRVDGVVSYRGATVTEELLLPVIARLQSMSARGIASSNMLGALDPGAKSYAVVASGALYIGLTEGTGDYLLLLRGELVETLVWAGNPDKAASLDESGRLRPRASFAAWKETVRGHSLPWSDLELENASFVREQLLRLQESEKLRKSEEHIRYLAEFDALTGLLNRHAISGKLEQSVKQAESDHSQIVVLFIDLDHFKPINDRYGHAAGDRILKITAKRMQHQVRSEDCVGRLGGDEFIIILPGLSLDTNVLKVVERILRTVEEPIEIEGGARVNVTASIGLSRYPVDGTSSEALISRSDMAMYRVKGSGGNAFDLSRADDAEDKENTTG